MTYSPHTPQDRAEMLAAIGVAGIEDLFTDVPAGVRFPTLNLPGPQSEMETLRELAELDGGRLTDIGLSREDALCEASKPFWRQ